MWFKRIALFFILIANTLVLAHLFIHHHHHNGVVVGVATVNSGHNCHNSFNGHSSDNDDDADCALREEILVPGRNFRFALNQQDDDQSLTIAFLNSFPDFCTTVNYSPCFSTGGKYEISQYLFLLNNSQGLRAPPLS